MEQRLITIGRQQLVADIADSEEDKVLGFQRYDAIEPNQAMFFPYHRPVPAGYHMAGVKFPIDILFLRAEGGDSYKIVRIVHNVQPGDADSYHCDNVSGVLEVSGGFCRKNRIDIYDPVSVKSVDAAMSTPVKWTEDMYYQNGHPDLNTPYEPVYDHERDRSVGPGGQASEEVEVTGPEPSDPDPHGEAGAFLQHLKEVTDRLKKRTAGARTRMAPPLRMGPARRFRRQMGQKTLQELDEQYGQHMDPATWDGQAADEDEGIPGVTTPVKGVPWGSSEHMVYPCPHCYQDNAEPICDGCSMRYHKDPDNPYWKNWRTWNDGDREGNPQSQHVRNLEKRLDRSTRNGPSEMQRKRMKREENLGTGDVETLTMDDIDAIVLDRPNQGDKDLLRENVRNLIQFLEFY